MSAKEMFEELGLNQVKNSLIDNVLNWNIDYETNKKYGRYVKVRFHSNKAVYVSLFDNETGEIGGGLIDVELHQAITQQMKELGWIE